MPNSGGITTGEASGVTEPPLAAAVSGEIMDGRASHDSNNKERPVDDPINSTLAGDYGANGSNSPMSADTLPQTAPLPPSHTSLRSIGSTKRPPPIKYGYLFKQSSGKWKRKRWNQRWFVLDYDTGALKYFRNASMPEAIPFRQDAHGMMQLKDPNVSLVIQSDLPRGIPTPFCFILADGNRQFIICADSNQEFREWTSAISVILSPRKATTDASSSTVVRNMPSMSSSMSIRSVETTEPVTTSTYSTDQTTETADGKSSAASTPPIDKSSIPVKGISNNVQAPTPVNDSFLSTPRQAANALLLVNPLVAVIRYGSIELLYVALFAVNVALVWLLWMRNAMLTASLSDSNSAEDKVRGDSAPSSTSPPKGRLSLDEGKKDHGILRHIRLPTSASTEDIIPHKFQGIVNGIQAKAGASVPMCPPSPAEIVVSCWCHISGSRFNVRQGPNYRKTKLKAPSDESLLHLVAIDVYRSSGKIDNIASLVDLSSLQRDLPLDLFIVNCQVPSYAPSNPLWGEKQGDGVGFNFVTYFAIPPDVRTLLNMDHPDHQAVRLLKEFMQESSTMHDRFKAIGIVVNPKEQNLGRTERHLLETYNGQPILTRPQHRFYRGANYFEVDVDAHEFNYVARKGLGGVSDHFRNMIVDFGFVLEGQEDDELPEQVLGGVRLGKIDVRHVPEIF